MTKRRRAQVVELLRCAADLAVMGDRSSALGIAAGELGRYIVPGLAPVTGGDGHWSSLLRGNGPVQDADRDDDSCICGAGYEFCLLEAAARVEEGSYP